MKKRFMAGTLMLLATLSCSTTSRLQSQAFDDGIYSRPSVVAQQAAPTHEELDNLLADSHSSEAYILSAGDTLVIPDGKNIRFSLKDNTITVWDTPSWAWNYSWSFRPWYMRDYYWSYYNPWYYDSWYYGSWGRYSFYDPWYWDPWYFDAWHWGPSYYPYSYYHHYGYYGWYRPWYSYYDYDYWYWHRNYPGYYAGYYYPYHWGGGARIHRSQAAHLGHREGNFSARGAASHSSFARSSSASRSSVPRTKASAGTRSRSGNCTSCAVSTFRRTVSSKG